VPALIEAALDCGVVFFVVFCIAFLIAVRLLIIELINILNVSILGVKLWPRGANWVGNHLLVWTEDAITFSVKILGDLLHAMAYMIRWQLQAMARFVHAVEHSLDLLWRHAIRGMISFALSGIIAAEKTLTSKLTALTAAVKADVISLKALIAKDVAAGVTKAETFATTEANKVAGELRKEIAADVSLLRTQISDLSRLLTSDVTSLVGTIEQQAAAVRAYADAAAAAGLRTAEAELAGLATTLEGDILTAEQLVEGELGSAVKTIDDLIASTVAGIEAQINGIAIPSIADLAATVAALGATVALVLAESGLDNPSCRSKVKGICGTDLNGFLGLLGGLALWGTMPSLRAIVDEGVSLVDRFAGDIETFVNAA